MTRDRDPDRRRPAPKHPGFEKASIDLDRDHCRWCGALVQAAEIDKMKHADWDQRIANRFAQLAERVAILEATIGQLSDPGLRPGTSAATPADASPGPDHNAGTGEARPGPHVARPSPNSPPTPAQEATQAGRAGAEGSNQDRTQAGAGLPPGAAPPPAVFPPAAGGTKRGSRPVDPGKAAGRLHLSIAEPPDHGRFAR